MSYLLTWWPIPAKSGFGLQTSNSRQCSPRFHPSTKTCPACRHICRKLRKLEHFLSQLLKVSRLQWHRLIPLLKYKINWPYFLLTQRYIFRKFLIFIDLTGIYWKEKCLRAWLPFYGTLFTWNVLLETKFVMI